MIKCCICGREIISSDLYVLFRSAAGEDMYGCEACKALMNTLREGENPAEVKEAVNYFHAYAKETEDDEVKGFLEGIVESNAAADKLSAAQEKKPIEQPQRNCSPVRNKVSDILENCFGLLVPLGTIGILVLIIVGINSRLHSTFVSIILGLAIFVFCAIILWVVIIPRLIMSGVSRKKRNKKSARKDASKH